jgi:molecular chaperone GrpE
MNSNEDLNLETQQAEENNQQAEPAVGKLAEDEPEPAEERSSFTVLDRRFWTLDQEELEDEKERRPSAPSFVEQLQQQLEDKDRQLKDYIAAYKTEVVEGLEKTKERLERDAATKIEQLRGQVAEPMMEVLEALERSLAAAQTNTSFEALHEGVRMVHMLMVQQLQVLGLQRIQTVGQEFNPALHEAVSVVPVAEPSRNNTILQEFRPGFTLGERLVRAAQVQVGKLG